MDKILNNYNRHQKTILINYNKHKKTILIISSLILLIVIVGMLIKSTPAKTNEDVLLAEQLLGNDRYSSRLFFHGPRYACASGPALAHEPAPSHAHARAPSHAHEPAPSHAHAPAHVFDHTYINKCNIQHNGLLNCGNSCYFNSVIQLLANVPELVDIYTNTTFDLDTVNYYISSIFKKLCKEPINTTGIDIREYVHKTLDKLNESKLPIFHLQKGIQEDGSEILREIIDTLNDHTSLIKIFNVNERSTHTFVDESIPYIDKSIDNTIRPMELPQFVKSITKNIMNVIDNASKNVLDDECVYPSNAVPRPCSRKSTFIFNSQYIIIVLKRNNEDLTKNNMIFNYEKYLDINNVKFDLIGIIRHHGITFNSGHYTTIVKHSDKYWYMYDDETVESLKTIELLITDKSEPYILMYKRR
jgi:hypothetical protein